MTTLPATKAPAPTLAQQDLPVPPQLTATRQVDGFRNPQWVAVPLAEGEREPVATAMLAVQLRLRPAHPKRILEMIYRLSIPHRKDHTAQEWEWLAHDFVEDLREFGEVQIAEAIREYRQSKPYFPKTHELIEICQSKALRDRMLERRARVLLGLEEARSWEVPPPVDDGKCSVFDIAKAMKAIEDGLERNRISEGA